MLYGPNTNLVVNGSLIFMIECAVDYTVSAITYAERTRQGAIDASEEALERFVDELDAGNSARAWGLDSVSNWYKSASGAVTQNWPFGLSDYWSRTRAVELSAHSFGPKQITGGGRRDV